MLEPSFGAVNLEDISQPNCFKVLDTLREACDIPVWHDDAQGTGSVTLAGLINALRIVDKPIADARIVFYGAGASNTTIARLILMAGADPDRMTLFDTKGGLHKKRDDVKADTAFYRKWELCETDQPRLRQDEIEEALKGADVLIALSKPGPDTVKPEWIRPMATQADRLRLREPGSRDLPLRGQGSRRLHRRDRPRRLPEPGQQLHGVPRHPEGRPAGPRAQDHRRDGDRGRLLGGELRREEGDPPGLHHADDGRDRGVRRGGGRRGDDGHRQRRGARHADARRACTRRRSTTSRKPAR